MGLPLTLINIGFLTLAFLFISSTLISCDAFETNGYSYENKTFYNNASSISINQTQPVLLNILVVSNDSSLRQDNYSLMLNNSADLSEGNKFEFELYNSTQYAKSTNFAEHFSEAVSTKLAGLFREWMKSFLSLKISVHKNRYNGKSETTSINIVSSAPTSSGLEPSESSGNAVNSDNESRKFRAQGRQFLFHPYVPYGKDVKPDEKISIHDVLPVKMVKFIKSMVEDAPWEQMFMKMVRMVVDQFVDKIIEQMFAHKDDEDHDKWRSLDNNNSPWTLLKHKMTSLVRLRRSPETSRAEKETNRVDSSSNHKSEKDDSWSESSFASANRISKGDSPKTKESESDATWLDSVLDFLFPEDDDKSKTRSSEKIRRKRSSADDLSRAENLQMKDILQVFLNKYLQLSTNEEQENILRNGIDSRQSQDDPIKNSNSLNDENSEEDIEDQYSTEFENESSEFETEEENPNNMPEPLPQRWSDLLKYNTHSTLLKNLERRKRSTETDFQKNSKRLWQASLKSHATNRRDECSLRRACNAGRLLARLPSVPDLTLQLKEYGNEPHWDALLWGMAKKRCSKIFCKRQRSPKGSKYYWNNPVNKLHRKHSPERLRTPKKVEKDLTTILPI